MFFFKTLVKKSEISINSNIPKNEGEEGFVYFDIEKKYKNNSDGALELFQKKGIFVRETEEYIEVYNDPYCSIPIYIYADGEAVYVTSFFEELLEKSLNIDMVGIYETLYFESALHDRTMFLEIKQLPAASYVKINKKTLEFVIETYWDFDIKENNDIKSEDEAAESVWNALCDAFRVYRENDLLMGISGGLDSRLSLCVLNHVADINKTDTFTFGYNKKILDYSLAKKVCEELGMKKGPRFFKLDGESYLQSMSLPAKSGGAVGVHHSHAYWCLQQIDTNNKTLISNYYSDAIMGYDCIKIDYDDTVENCDYYKTVIEDKWQLSEEMKREIIKDIRKITSRRKEDSNYSCYNEFIYLVERNPKFHVRLSHMYNEHMEVVLPYAQYHVLEALISLPLQYRYRKKIEYLILARKFMDMKDISSTRYAAFDEDEQSKWNKLYYDLGFLKMRAVNMMNCGLGMISSGRWHFPNKYITENHLMIMNKYFSEYRKQACKDLFESGIITEVQKENISKICKRTQDAHLAFKLISVWNVLQFGK